MHDIDRGHLKTRDKAWENTEPQKPENIEKFSRIIVKHTADRARIQREDALLAEAQRFNEFAKANGRALDRLYMVSMSDGRQQWKFYELEDLEDRGWVTFHKDKYGETFKITGSGYAALSKRRKEMTVWEHVKWVLWGSTV